MSIQDDFVNGLTGCMSSEPFPAITLPGLGNFALSCFLSTFAGISYILNFIPPSVDNPPSLPSINLFLDPFMANLSMPPSYPSFNISVGGLSLPFPGVGSGPPERDVSGEITTAAVCVALPFLLIKNMITDLLNLQITLPTLSGIESLLVSLFAEVGIAGSAITQFISCLAQAVFNLFTALI